MKKIMLFVAVIALVFQSCESYDLSDPVDANSFPKSLVTGIVRAEFDAQLGETPVPAGTVLVFAIPNSNFLAGAQGNYILTTTVGENGEYSINIPVTTAGVTAKVSSSDFIATYKDTDNVTYEKIYSLSDQSVSVFQNTSTIENFTFDGEEINDVDDENRIEPKMTSKLSGALEYLYRTTDEGDLKYEAIPNGTVIKVKITLTEFDGDASEGKYEEYQTIEVSGSGKYTIEVPMIYDGKAEVEMKSAVVLEYTEYDFDDDKNVTKFYRYSLDQTVMVYEKDINDKDFKYVQGDSPLN